MLQTHSKTNTEQGVLASLRAVVPQRPLYHSEALRVAELQANRLLARFQITKGAVPEEIISELPRIRVEYETALPVSGSAHWNGRYWVITLNGDEPHTRQRFSLAHEFKHVLDHGSKHFSYDRSPEHANERAERIADYFAACLLMPKRVVTSLWCSGWQDIPALAAKLQVSAPALRYRLAYLGLTEPVGRCGRAQPKSTAMQRVPGPRRPSLAILYARSATSEQFDTLAARNVRTQHKACRAKARALGATIEGEYSDVGASGRNLERPSLKALLARLKCEPRIDYLIVHRHDRLTRNLADQVRLSADLRASGVELISCTDRATPSPDLLRALTLAPLRASE
jgi:Zn-dependent peptidase ImmA (M78 family)